MLRRCAPVELRPVRGAGSPAVFDLNDFDETLPAPFEWDVKRLVASFVVAARGNGHRRRDQRAAARTAAAAYRTTIAKAATMRFLDVWYTRFDADKLLADLAPKVKKAEIKSARKALAKAQTRTSLGSLSKFAQRVDGGYRIKQQPPVIVRPPETMTAAFEQVIRQGLADYASSLGPDRRVVLDHYHYEDFARKVVGVGSVGTEALMVLLMGDREDDPLFLQLKQASTSVLAPYAGASEYKHQGERVVHGQRLMQAASDAFLGWITGTGKRKHEFYVRQLRDMKGSAAVETMTPARLALYGRALRRHPGTRARAHRQRGEDHRLPRRRRHLRPCTRTLRRRLRRPERRRLRGVHRRRGGGPHRGRTRRLTSHGARRTTTVDPRYCSVCGTNRWGSSRKPTSRPSAATSCADTRSSSTTTSWDSYRSPGPTISRSRWIAARPPSSSTASSRLA